MLDAPGIATQFTDIHVELCAKRLSTERQCNRKRSDVKLLVLSACVRKQEKQSEHHVHRNIRSEVFLAENIIIIYEQNVCVNDDGF